MSDTPRTEAVWEKFETDLRGELEPDVEFSTLARQLERELNAANAEIEEKRKDVVWLATEKAKLENYVMMLELVGNDMVTEEDVFIRLKIWMKAKEAKL